MTINQIAHLRVGFAGLEEGPVNKSVPNHQYAIHELKRCTALFALEEKEGAQSWVHLDDNFACDFERPPTYAYMAGPVYEAESRQRTVNGRVLSAENYIRMMKAVPTSDLTSLDGCSLHIDLWIRAKDEPKVHADDWFGWTFDRGLKTVVEGDFIKVSIPVVNLNNLLLAVFAPWSGKGRVMTIDMAAAPQVSPVAAPMGCETQDLF